MKQGRKSGFPYKTGPVSYTHLALPQAGRADSGEPQDAIDVEKHETVYVNLDNTGKLTSISVCNYFAMEAGKTYRDYGSYEEIKNLTDKMCIRDSRWAAGSAG